MNNEIKNEKPLLVLYASPANQWCLSLLSITCTNLFLKALGTAQGIVVLKEALEGLQSLGVKKLLLFWGHLKESPSLTDDKLQAFLIDDFISELEDRITFEKHFNKE